jgi:thiol-disulfide isomerase/thioredoxin
MHKALRRALLVLAAFVVSVAHAADVRLEGQVVCCEDCWNKADRTKVLFGTTEDLAKSAGCVANGDPTLLAVNENGRTVMYQLEPGRYRLPGPNWLEHIGDKVAVTGATREQKGKRFVRVHELQVLQRSIASEEGRKALGTVPELKLADLSGVEQTLASRRGRIVVLNFWGTFCLPCAKEMPDLAAVQSNYAALGVEVIGAAADTAEDRAKVLSFIKKYRINFPVWLGASFEDMRRFGLGEALPATVILDREGKIVWQKRGITTKGELTQQIDAFIAKAAPAASLPSQRRVDMAQLKPKSPDASRVPS